MSIMNRINGDHKKIFFCPTIILRVFKKYIISRKFASEEKKLI